MHANGSGVTELRFSDGDNSNYVGFRSSATVGSNRIWTLPSGDGSNGTVLSTDGNGNLSWISQPTAPVTTVAGRTGAVTLTSSDVSEGSNLYFTSSRSRQALSASGAISYNQTTGVVGVSTASSVSDGVLSSNDFVTFSNKQNALGYVPVNKAGDSMSGSLNMGGSYKVTNLAAPTSGTDAATKTYVDDGSSLKASVS